MQPAIRLFFPHRSFYFSHSFTISDLRLKYIFVHMVSLLCFTSPTVILMEQNFKFSLHFFLFFMLFTGNDDDIDNVDPKKTDPEFFIHDCLTVDEVEKLLNEYVEKLSTSLKIIPSLAKVLLHENKWDANGLVKKYRDNASSLLVSSRIKSGNGKKTVQATLLCPVCVQTQSSDKFHSLSCAHSFCKNCWSMHFEIQISQGISTQIRCMAANCDIYVPEDLVLNLVSRPNVRDKYQQFAFQDYVKSHPELRFCPGKNCQIIIRSQDNTAKKASCKACDTSFCFQCGCDYHAPTDCLTIRRWLTKCADDSETANYISANTKDCPKCNICIEKNGGCNHMVRNFRLKC